MNQYWKGYWKKFRWDRLFIIIAVLIGLIILGVTIL